MLKYFASFFSFGVRYSIDRYSIFKNEPQNVEVFCIVLFSFGVRYSIFKNEPHNFEVFCIVVFPSAFDIRLIDIRYSKTNRRISKYFASFFFPSAFDIQLIDIRYSKIKNEPQNRRTPNRRISKYFASFFFPSTFDIQLINIRYSKMNHIISKYVALLFFLRHSIFKNQKRTAEC